jgi:hypothetical protein
MGTTGSSRTALGSNGQRRSSTLSTGTASQQHFEAASNSATSPLNFAPASYQQEKISTETKLGTIIGAQRATDLRSATTTSSNAQQSAVNAGCNKATSTLRKWLDSTTDPKVSDIMAAGLCSYFQSKPLDCSEFEEYNATYHNLILLHESIRWGYFLRGKMSK